MRRGAPAAPGPARRRAGAALLLAALAAGPAAAHDFWIEPSSFRPAVGSVLALGLRVGQEFRGDPVGRNPLLLERFSIVGPGGEAPALGWPGGEPAGRVRVREAGLLVAVYHSRPSQITLPAAAFESYLAAEGLEAVSRMRAAAGASGAPGRERYSRCAKALIRAVPAGAGAGAAGAALEPVGLPLEIVPEADPTRWRGGGTLPARLLFRGRPLAGALVVALSRQRPGERLEARSDRSGRVRLRLSGSGVWRVEAVHMIPAEGPPQADWESFWASLTFEVRNH